MDRLGEDGHGSSLTGDEARATAGRHQIAARGWGDDVDVIFTTDHGELQGDFGLDADRRGFERVLMFKAQRADLLADLWDHQPPMHAPRRRVEAPV